MASSSLVRISSRAIRSLFSPSKNLINNLHQLSSHHITRPVINQTRTFGSETLTRSPFDSNIIRILGTEIDYQFEYAPPDSPPAIFNSFSVEDHPGEQFIRLTRKFGEKEDIRVEATMFDGCISHPKVGDDDGEDVHFHISLVVDIYKGEGSDGLGFICSAWPDGLEIVKVYMLPGKGTLPKAYMGPDLRRLDPKIQKALHQYLEARGVSDELSVFLHQVMVSKDRTEYLRWLETVKSFVEQ